ncbi:hypothetical protein GCM10010109_41370 [Actinoplanes campanulatus]|nr:hypothetical protein GCM10010109_41370 [Actinoplanes campanulatus]GID39452.1 hypothetical protein Aca09nite_59580 [Actinoplanes campanulatus]
MEASGGCEGLRGMRRHQGVEAASGHASHPVLALFEDRVTAAAVVVALPGSVVARGAGVDSLAVNEDFAGARVPGK